MRSNCLDTVLRVLSVCVCGGGGAGGSNCRLCTKSACVCVGGGSNRRHCTKSACVCVCGGGANRGQ